MSTPGRPKGEYRSAQREGNPMSAAGESRGRLYERGEAQARSARPRVWAAADTPIERMAWWCKEAAQRAAPRDWSDVH